VSSFRDQGSVDDAEDPILRVLRTAAREVEHVDARWLALAEGRLDSGEAEVLREQASRTEDGRLLWGLFQVFNMAAQRQAASRGQTTEGSVCA
jgi:hypothetical protein